MDFSHRIAKAEEVPTDFLLKQSQESVPPSVTTNYLRTGYAIAIGGFLAGMIAAFLVHPWHF